MHLQLVYFCSFSPTFSQGPGPLLRHSAQDFESDYPKTDEQKLEFPNVVISQLGDCCPPAWHWGMDFSTDVTSVARGQDEVCVAVKTSLPSSFLRQPQWLQAWPHPRGCLGAGLVKSRWSLALSLASPPF